MAWSASQTSSSKAISRSFDFDEWREEDTGRSCFPDGGYGDINSTTQVVVNGPTGDEVGRSNLGDGRIESLTEEGGFLVGCRYSFEVSVPEGLEYYVVSVGNRGESSYTWEEIQQPDAIDLSLGFP